MRADDADPVARAAGLIAGAVLRWRRPGPGVLVAAVDGHGGAGKSTIAAAAAARLAAAGAVVVHTDDFFRPAGPAAPRELRDYYDWPRLVREALVPLRAGREATFRRFDWDLGRPGAPASVPPGPVVLLEGVLSAAPELAGQVDRRVLVDTPQPDRLARLRARISPQDWDEAWLAAECRYFSARRGPGGAAPFDLIVSGAGPRPGPGRPPA